MKKKMIKTVALAGMMVVTSLAFVGCGKKTIDISEYAVVEFEGENGNGNAVISVDWDLIQSEYGKDLEYTKAAKDEYGEEIALWYGMDTEGKIDLLRDATEKVYEKSNTLSNGDEFTYTFEFDEDLEGMFNYEITASEVTVEVEGLE